MSKLVLMIFTLVILATILSNHSVQSRNRWKQLNQKSESLCTCTFHRHNLVTLKTQDSSKADGQYVCKQRNVHEHNLVTLKTQDSSKADGQYVCKQRNGKVEPSKDNSKSDGFYSISIPF
ncbi:hypothetical protein PGIGA_G00201540 [Pangasianodon gigas]|uniref:Uncharacterized protein n=1 Tax=Pangasianodon gigas TaxID=30993 RepID=A0ACC5WDW1_PANGG|nr:hypothetical protein [Pangasianodon gigas]